MKRLIAIALCLSSLFALCACGAKKHGQFNHNEGDLLSEIDSQYPAGYMQQRGAA